MVKAHKEDLTAAEAFARIEALLQGLDKESMKRLAYASLDKMMESIRGKLV